MFLFKNIQSLQAFLLVQKTNGKTIGLVPTMGALHKGHLSLVNQSKTDGHLTVCSVFVNPTQFNQQEDFEKYPKTIDRDIQLLAEAGCDVLFHPDSSEMYPDGFVVEHYDFGNVTNTLEGFYRPGHFNGVITIVKKLFDAVKPDHAYFGQKDFQQCAVINKLIHYFNLNIRLHIVPIMREVTGLAMSSRNARLSNEEKQTALLIWQTLNWMNENRKALTVKDLKEQAKTKLSEQLQTEYVEIVDTQTFNPVEQLGSGNKSVALITAWCGNVRLIDNLLLGD